VQQVTTRNSALVAILLSNLATLALAVLLDWSILHLMWPFWAQSLIIGWYARSRILKLVHFSTDGLKFNNRPVPPTRSSLRKVAGFFLLHYGFFHVGYLVFLLAFSTTADARGFIEITNESTGATSLVQIGRVHPLDFLAFAVLGVFFWHAHRRSHEQNVARDLEGQPNVGKLMFLPYARILPMHFTIILGIPLGGGALWIFVVLKTAADLIMHHVEHRVLGGSGAHGPRPSDSTVEA